ncbi:hypothetical protein PLUTE_b0257 [Pseudoalteromonas luteoviolacea DSM 6061]|nr:hypothetical protein [Pseudoalteromonas luteoviolacea DSM 6061]
MQRLLHEGKLVTENQSQYNQSLSTKSQSDTRKYLIAFYQEDRQ